MKRRLDGNKSEGMTLLEMMLVLAIAGSIILAGLRVYQSSETDNNYLILRSNVDFLFQAMQGYYQQECDLYFSADGSVRRRGLLTFNPNNGDAAPDLSPVPFDVTLTNQYISAPWPRYVSVVGRDTTAYRAQYNPSSGKNKQAYVCASYNSPRCSEAMLIPESNIVLWQAQIVVKMIDPSKTTYYVGKAGADCAVNSVSSAAPVDCSTGVKMGDSAAYMVWQRMPSFSSTNIRSSHWISNPSRKIFKQQYTHDPMYELYNSNPASTEVNRYYYCGG
jgi:prepilin-type N-terminal cleavage/methylation domain-containing protein